MRAKLLDLKELTTMTHGWDEILLSANGANYVTADQESF